MKWFVLDDAVGEADLNKVAGCDVAFEIGAGVRVPWKLSVVIKVDMLSSGYKLYW